MTVQSYEGGGHVPKETFFNLSQSKRDRIVEAAISEFSQKNYHQVSISSIVKAASIPKGSFYQYFQDKKDLFRYIVELIYRKKMQIMSEVMDIRKGVDVFSLLRAMIDAGIAMVEQDPQLSEISERFLADKALYREIMDEYEEKSSEFVKSLVEKGIEQGDIPAEIDPQLATRFILMSMKAISEEISASGVYELEQLRKNLYSFVEIIENGLRRKIT